MDFKQYSPEELKECSMIEVVHSVLGDKRQATTFNELVQEIAQVLGLSQEQVNAKIAQFYTDLNIDGRFINLGENRWGLRSWYPYEQIDEEILPQPKPKKKRKVEDDFAEEELEYDETEEEEEEL
ncbi:DNA-directed RNA polymerase subunit delta [Bacillus anthracis]|uniref:DNA-directed RNA polymerase subunit delta n=1 Tax=Bacillus anthracis TaxID=1392 RepID=UPI001AE05EA4|nr:DNA-directed RNA polymerase subunit delta [Bacillus anthracis]MBP0840408.1 DNA-directed RNA polymerase subunit delta [Bacillus anthracis]